MVVKPRGEGQSLGLSRVTSFEELGEALQKAFEYDDVAIVERFVAGMEINVGILDGRVLGAVEVNRARHRVTVSGEPVELTATEFDLLAYLMERPGRVITRDQLLSAVWGYSAAAGTRTVDVHVAQVRAKLGAASPIRTVRGVGYSADEA